MTEKEDLPSARDVFDHFLSYFGQKYIYCTMKMFILIHTVSIVVAWNTFHYLSYVNEHYSLPILGQ